MQIKRYPFPEPDTTAAPWGVKYVCVLDGDLNRLEATSNEDEHNGPALRERIKELGYMLRTAQVTSDDWRTMYESRMAVLEDVRKELDDLNGQLQKAKDDANKAEYLHRQAVAERDKVTHELVQLQGDHAELEKLNDGLRQRLGGDQLTPLGVMGDNDGPYRPQPGDNTKPKKN